MALKVTPLDNRLLVRRLEAADKSPGGILLPDDAREKPMTGRVLGFGPGKRGPDGKPVPMGFKEGDEVMFGKYAGTEVDLEGSTYLFITSEDVLCTVDRNGKQEPKPEVQAAAPEPIKEEPKVEVKPEEVTAEVK